MDKTATQVVMEQLLPFSLEQALALGPLVQLTVGFRNSNQVNNSFFMTMLVAKPNVQAATDALDNLNILTIEDLVTQTVTHAALLVGSGLSARNAQEVLETKLLHLGRIAKSESLRLQALLLTSDLILTVTETGVNFGEFIGDETWTLESVIGVLQKAEAAAVKQSATQSLEPDSGAETSYGAKLAAAINKTS